jgi:hypothetical protein
MNWYQSTEEREAAGVELHDPKLHFDGPLLTMVDEACPAIQTTLIRRIIGVFASEQHCFLDIDGADPVLLISKQRGSLYPIHKEWAAQIAAAMRRCAP